MLRRIELGERTDVLGGKPMGSAGPYERIVARAWFEADPDAPANRIVTDIGLAPRNENGRVEYSADLYVLKPRDPARGNGTLLFDVANRGFKLMLLLFHRGADFSLDPRDPAHFGDCFLLEQGFTLVWLGWQWDAPAGAGYTRFYAPVATDHGKPIRGLVRSEMVADRKVFSLSLGDQGQVPYPVSDPADPSLRLTVRDQGYGPRADVPRSLWQLAREEDGKPVADRSSVYLAAGFEPGRLYELIYTAENPPVAGLGPAAIRDLVSFLKYGGPGDGVTMLGDQHNHLKRAICFGASQSGRFVRKFLYDGFNGDEQKRRVFDGMWSHLAGSGRGSFNHRFAQPSRGSDPQINFDYPTFLPPFDDAGLLENARRAGVQPRLFLTNTSYEYWAFAASLVHTDLEGRRDVASSPDTRVYSFAGTQHAPGPFPPRRTGSQHDVNPNDFHWFLRGLLLAIEQWVAGGKEAPPSQHPRLDAGALVPITALRFPTIRDVRLPGYAYQARVPDFGPRFLRDGIVDREPPAAGPLLPTLVPQVDADGNETAGLRTPALQVPLATYSGWNLRDPSTGAPGVLADNVGSVFPFPRTRQQRVTARDPRPSIEERYPGRGQYLAKVRAAAERLVADRYLRPEDIAGIVEQAGAQWDHWTGSDA